MNTIANTATKAGRHFQLTSEAVIAAYIHELSTPDDGEQVDARVQPSPRRSWTRSAAC